MTKEQIQQEYTNLCAKAGDVAYKIKQFEAELAKIHAEIDQLNIFAGLLRAEEAKTIMRAVDAKES